MSASTKPRVSPPSPGLRGKAQAWSSWILGDTYSATDRAERLIAGGRLSLAVVALVGLWAAPWTSPFRAVVLSFCGLYAGYSLLVAVAVWRVHRPLTRLRLITHIVDLTAFLALYVTENPLSSSLFLFFVFSLMGATLRWQWQGTVWTALAALLLSVGAGFYLLLHEADFAPHQFIIRSVYVTVAAVLLGYLALHEMRLRREMSRLAEWPSALPGDLGSLLEDILRHAADLARAPRALLLLEEFDEPWVHVASWSTAGFESRREGPEAYTPLITPRIAGCDFVAEDLDVPDPSVLYASGSIFKRWEGQPLHDALRQEFRMGSVVGVRLASENFSGYLFVLDKRRIGRDDIRLGRLLVRQAAARLDHFYLMEQRRRAAAAEERVHLARDLHDGLLQSLTAIALKLEGLRTLVEEDTQATQKQLVSIQRLVLAEQRYLRFFIRQLRPTAKPDLDAGLLVRLELLAHRVELEWGLSVDLRCPFFDDTLATSLGDTIYYLVSEAVVNAARHARASVVSVDIDLAADGLRMVVEDNGCGFPFRGRLDGPALHSTQQGPVTLMERVAAADGIITIESSNTGARIEILLPTDRRLSRV